jgi:membrane protein DedA with SNARE-associated domain
MARSGGFPIGRSGWSASPAVWRRSGLQDSAPVTREPALARHPPSPHTLKLLVAPVIFLVICSNIANVMWPTLQEDHPLLLIALSSINRYLILVSDQLDPVSYYVVGTLRLLVSDPLFFLLGYWYGDRALEWMDQKSPGYGPMLRRAQRWFGKAAWPLVVIAPNNFICLFAGAAGMRIGWFFALNLAGTLGRLYLIRVLGEAFASPIDSFQDLVGEYRWWFIGGSFLLVMFSLRGEVKGGGEIDQLVHIDEELAEPAEAAEPQAEEER